MSKEWNKLIEEKETALTRGGRRLAHIWDLEERLRKAGQTVISYRADVNHELKTKDSECYHCESTAKRLREELSLRKASNDECSQLAAQVSNLVAANKALNRARAAAAASLAEKDIERAAAIHRVGMELSAKMATSNREYKKLQSKFEGLEESRQAIEFDSQRWEKKYRRETRKTYDLIKEAKEIPTISTDSKSESKKKHAKEKRRLLVAMSGYSADVLKTFVKWATPVFIVAIIAIAIVQIYG